MNMKLPGTIFSLLIVCGLCHGHTAVRFAGEKKLNGVASELLEISSVSKPSNRFTFSRSNDGWIFVAATFRGKGMVGIFLDKKATGERVILRESEDENTGEAMHYVKRGKHQIEVECPGMREWIHL